MQKEESDRLQRSLKKPFNELSGRELEVLSYVCGGYTSREIAGKLFRSFRTIETHRKKIRRIVEVNSLRGLCTRAFEAGLDVDDIKNEVSEDQFECLTPRELQVLKQLTTDKETKILAAELGISPHTFHTHKKNMYNKLLVTDDASLAYQAVRFFKKRKDAGHEIEFKQLKSAKPSPVFETV